MRAPLSLTLCLLSLLATAQEVENPVWATNWPDPTIWQAENGMYYCLATNPRRMLHSTNLFHWAIDDRSLPSRASPATSGHPMWPAWEDRGCCI